MTTTLLPDAPVLTAFLIASLVLAITPGPGVFYIVTRSLVQGRRSGLASVAGVAVGNFGNALAAALGLATLFAVSATAFSIVKFAGAVYLVVLGVRMLLRPSREPDDRALAPLALGQIFRDGALVALLNPKTTIFFAAFLPQFMDMLASPLPQSVALSALFVGIAALTDSVYAIAAGALAAWIARASAAPRLGRWIGGSTFIGLGAFAAFTGHRSVR